MPFLRVFLHCSIFLFETPFLRFLIYRYSTLDHELIAQLNAKKQIQDRYHPAPLLNYKSKKEPSKDTEDSSKPSSDPNGPPTGPSSSGMFEFSNPTFSEGYDYKPLDYPSNKPISKPPDYLSDKPISKPMSMDDYADSEISDKVLWISKHHPTFLLEMKKSLLLKVPTYPLFPSTKLYPWITKRWVR